MQIMRMGVSDSWLLYAKAGAVAIFRWIIQFVRAVFTAMFIPTETDRQINEHRERVRRYLMRS